MSFPKRFDTSREADIYKQSIEAWYFKPEYNADKSQETFVLPVPPPNVTWVLHLGHALTVTIEDAFCRYHRMKGKQVLFLPGTDHAGISTQVQVEKKLKKEQDITRHDLGRVDFLKKVREFASEHRQIILNQFKKIWASVDWDREQFTLSEWLSRAVRKTFKSLYDQKKVYLGYRIANRCKRCQTVLSDAEVDMEVSKSKLYQVRYFLIGWKNIHIDVYTTRPETIPADVALAVHPADKRYKHIIWKEVMVPFVNRKIPVITDESVDMAFGSWVLKITPAHDQTDFDIGSKHGLPLDMFAIDKQGKWTNSVPEFAGYEIEKFFDTYIERLKEIGNLIAVQEYENSTPHCERCNTKIEPLASEQWFMDVKEYAQKSMEVIDDGIVKVYPERSIAMFHQRLDNIKPWCISRQLRWGHRIPVWHNEQGDIIAADEDFIYEKFITQKEAPRTKNQELKTILSLIIFNLMADSKIESKFEFQDLLDILLRDCLVKHDWLIYELYLRIYASKFKDDKDILAEIKNLQWLLDNLKNWSAYEESVEWVLEILQSSYGLKQERQFFVWDREQIAWYKNMKQDTDVLDTRFSSCLRPFSTMGWPEQTSDLKKYFPMTLLETWADILFPRVCRMMIMSYANMGELPFKNIYFHGLIRDEKWAKMSKSKGNGIDPLDLITKYGTDALRLSLVVNNPAGNDLNFGEARTEYYARFITKLWNASRYVRINAIGEEGQDNQEPGSNNQELRTMIDLDVLRQYIKDNQNILNDFDIWILNGLDDLIQFTDKQFATYNFTQAVDDIVKFTRNNFCDRYIEIAKIQKHELSEKIMLYIIGTLLKLLQPVAPFVTQALYSDIGFADALCVSSFPSLLGIGSMNTQTKLFIELISEFRNLKHELGIKPNEKISVLIKANTNIANMIKQYEAMFCKIVTCEELTIISVNHEIPSEYATKLVFDIAIGIKTVTPVDVKAQIAKLEEQLVTETKFVADLQSLLNSEWFLKSAPEDIRATKQAKFDEVKSKVQQIEVELQRLKYLGN